MPDPIMMAIAGAVAGKATEGVAKLGQLGYEKLKTLVKRKFSNEPTAQAALEAAESDPTEEKTSRLAAALELLAAMDGHFDDELRHAGGPLVANRVGDVTNINTGSVGGNQFQAGIINYRDGVS